MPINKKKGSPRYGQRYRVGRGGSHVYRIKGKRVVIGGRKPRKLSDPYKPQVDAAVNLEFGESDLELDKARRISGQASRNTDAWWRGYQADLERARQTTQQGYQQAQQGVYTQANTARSQDAARSAEMDAEAQRAAALRGTTAGPNVAAQAQGARQERSNAFGGLIASQGASQNAYLADQYRIGGGIRALELGKEAGRGRTIEEEARKVASRKGAYRVAKRQELEDAFHKKRLEILTFEGKAAAEAFDQQFKLQSQRQAARDRAAQRRLTRRGQNLTNRRTIRGQNLTDRRAREKAAKGGGGKGKKGAFTPTQVRASRDKYLNIADVARNNKTDKKGRPHTWGWLYKNARAANKGVPPDLVKAALQRGLYGGVEPALAKRIKRMYGLSVKVRKKPKLRRPGNAPSRGGVRPT